MRKLYVALLIMALSISARAQNDEQAKNSWGGKLAESNFHLGVDIQSKYVWRGMEMITDAAAPVLFPAVNYSKNGFSAYVMGGYAINGQYAEVDMGLSYTYKWFTFGVNDYYYPTTDAPTDHYFNFKSSQTGHWIEGVITIAPDKIPAYMTVSNFFYGADKDMEGKQAYSTYAEVGAYYDFLNDNRLSLTLGAAFNKSCYNGYESGFGICNIELKYTYNLAIKDFSIPLSVAYIINPVYGKSFVNFTASLAF